MIFDPAKFGLLSHYPPDAQQRIRRLMLEDWKAAGVKLPTYMKLVARFIASTGVSEGWLAKLSHQTMDKMLKLASTPRYEFWACLHLYLIRKYGPLDISPELTDPEILGQAVCRFGSITDAPDPGEYEFDGRSIVIETEEGRPYGLAECVETQTGPDPFGVKIERKHQGIAVAQGNRMVAVLRDAVSLQITTIALKADS
ncbi:hypothetical protein [Hyphobacterium indicum]|uniref:hypothetical protein n=1 Tax=Hyphobacterium indicum TaxID=2162714 RepID=UPI000D65CF36|nr:hypothetical protein [Hyphobacterium indicum]